MSRPKNPPPLSVKRPPGTTPEARDLEIISKAYDLAEQQIEAGTAGAQVMVHFLRLGTEKEKLEQQKLAGEIELQKARISQIESQANIEQLFTKAISAMISYQGGDPTEYDEQDGTGELSAAG